MRQRNLLLLVLLGFTTIAARAQLTTYTDPKTGVSFKYPSVWVTSDKNPSYLGQAYMSETAHPRASFSFSPVGNLYEHTLLLDLAFSYFVAPMKDSASCTKSVADAQSETVKPKAVEIHGIHYQQFDGAQGGMCHQQANQLNVTYRDGQCFVFERDFDTQCYGADETRRKLTNAQMKALQRHLDEIMQSVVFAPLKP
jgi:hypothetical protein